MTESFVTLRRAPQRIFYLLVITQGGHFLEHVAQMVQALGHSAGRGLAPGRAQLHHLGLPVDGHGGHTGPAGRGRRLRGGLDLTRPDLHFPYNVIETLPLFVAFGWQQRRTYHQSSATWGGSVHTLLTDAADAADDLGSLLAPRTDEFTTEGATQ